MYSKSVVESFCLEIISNTERIKRDADKISHHDFPSKASEQFIKSLVLFSNALKESTEVIFKKIDFEDNESYRFNFIQLRQIMYLTYEVSKLLHYIEQSKMSKSPWGLTSPLQDIANKIIPDSEIILYQDWNHNYSIITKNFNELLREQLLENIQMYISIDTYSQIKQSLVKPLYLISFPHMDKKNILQFSLLGHELGHLYADKKLTSLDIKGHVNNDKTIMNFLSSNEDKTNTLKLIETVWKRLFEELLSDVVGTVLFGPAMLFSMFEFATQLDIDLRPQVRNDFYPPWRSRLRLSYEMVLKMIPTFENQNYGNSLFNNKIVTRISEIKNIVTIQKDLDLLKDDPILNIYNNVVTFIQQNFDDVLNDLRNDNFDEQKFINNIQKLTDERLTKGLTPNTIDDLNVQSNATLCEILNAAWHDRIAWEENIFTVDGTFDTEYLKKRKMLNDLTNKAIEFSDLTNNYLKENS